MIRVALYFILVGAIAYGVALLADPPGDGAITWQGLRIETSLMVLGAAMLAAMLVLGLIISLIRSIARSPMVLAQLLRNRRGTRAYEAISRGLIAVGAGDVAAAQRFTAQVQRLAPGEPLALLLTAQAAQLAGDREGAERTFHDMAAGPTLKAGQARPDPRASGLLGLYTEAGRGDAAAGAHAYAEEAARTAPALSWAGTAVLEARCRDGDWAGALNLLEQQRSMLDK